MATSLPGRWDIDTAMTSAAAERFAPPGDIRVSLIPEAPSA